MPRERELTPFERGQVIGMCKAGKNRLTISNVLKIPKSTVRDTINRYAISQNGTSEKRSGRPRALNDNDQQQLRNILKENNRLTLAETQQKFQDSQNKIVSEKTIRKNLHQLGLHSRIAASKPFLNESQRVKRLQWCINHQDWSVQKWKTVIWSDESRFTLYQSDGPCRVWREAGARFNIENLSPSIKHGGGGIMVWGCFSGRGLGPLVKVDGKMNRFDYIQILNDHLLPLVHSQFHRRPYAFQDDNAPVHRAKDVENWIAEKNIKVLSDWPSQSPDLNPIEHLWNELEQKIRKRYTRPKNLRELEMALQEEWRRIPSEVYINLIESMPKRINACIESQGWPTKY